MAQLAGLDDLSRARLQWPVRVGRPSDTITSVADVSGPDYATSVGLLLWGFRRGTVQRVAPPPTSRFMEKIMHWLRNLLPVSN